MATEIEINLASYEKSLKKAENLTRTSIGKIEQILKGVDRSVGVVSKSFLLLGKSITGSLLTNEVARYEQQVNALNTAIEAVTDSTYASINALPAIFSAQDAGASNNALVNSVQESAKEAESGQDFWEKISAGGKKSLTEYVKKAEDSSKLVSDFFLHAFSACESFFDKWITSGKSGFKDFAKLVVQDLGKVLSKILLIAAAEKLMSWLGISVDTTKKADENTRIASNDIANAGVAALTGQNTAPETAKQAKEAQANNNDSNKNKDFSLADTFKGSLEKFIADSDSITQTVGGFFQHTFTSAAQYLETFVTTGKANFKEFARSVLADLAKILVKVALLKTFEWVAGMISPASAAGSGSGSTTYAGMNNAAALFKSRGGYITGAGTATSDSIPAWLSNGEYIINAATVSRYGQSFFDDLNNNRFSSGGMIGGIASLPAIGSGAASSVVNNVTVSVYKDGSSDSMTNTEEGQTISKRVVEMMRNIANEQIVNNMRPGGLLVGG